MSARTKAHAKEYNVDVYDANGKRGEKLELNKKVFDGKVNSTLLYEATVMYAACKRQGTASTKNRSEVRGGGKKPWRQKGTGRARFGSIRNPIWRGGGVAFGPRPRDYSYSMTQKARLRAVQSALNDKLENKRFLVMDEIKIEEPKTKHIRVLLNKLKLSGRTLLVLGREDAVIKRAARNMRELTIRQSAHVCSDDILRCEHVLLTKDALQQLTKRLQL